MIINRKENLIEKKIYFILLRIINLQNFILKKERKNK